MADAILTLRALRLYRTALVALQEADVPVLVGGAYACERYTGIARHTKDLDLFVRRRDAGRALAVLAETGYETELTFPHWLGKAFAGDEVIDVIFSSGNGVAEVDDAWFTHAVACHVFGIAAYLCPPEEMIWSKAFIMERERFDGADVVHLLHACSGRLDWPRLLERFGPHWRVLLSHLVLFGFVYPDERARVPEEIMASLLERLSLEWTVPPAAERLCQGTLLSRQQYLTDVAVGGYRDARLLPDGPMTAADVARWTAAIVEET